MSVNKHIKLPIMKNGTEVEMIVHIDHIVSIVPYVSNEDACLLVTTRDEYTIPKSFETIENFFKLVQFNEQISSLLKR